MTPNDGIDTILRNWLTAEAPAVEPVGLHRSAIDAARGRRQRPGWLVSLRGGTITGPVQIAARSGLRYVYVVLLVALILALLVVAIAGSGLLRVPRKPALGTNGTIAFAVSDARTTSLHLMNGDGTGDRVVREGTCPAYSQDGSVLAFRVAKGTFPGMSFVPNWELWASGDDGLTSRPVPTVTGGSAGSLSPDGSRVVSVAAMRTVTHEQPDGGSSGFEVAGELWVTPVNGEPAVRVVDADFAPDEGLSEPVWSPDGLSIAFVGMTAVFTDDNAGIYRSSIYVVGADGTNLRRLTSRPGGGSSSMQWSPDSRYIAYTGVPDGEPAPSFGPASEAPTSFYPSLDIFVIDVGGQADRNVTNTKGDERDTKWSPDGLRLAYLLLDTDAPGWRLQALEMTDAVPVGPPLVDLEQAGFAPGFQWSPDGTRILGVSGDPSGGDTADQIPTTMWWIDRDLRGPRTPLLTVNGIEGWTSGSCGPSWQRLAP